jgi:hypothetical protein
MMEGYLNEALVFSETVKATRRVTEATFETISDQTEESGEKESILK